MRRYNKVIKERMIILYIVGLIIIPGSNKKISIKMELIMQSIATFRKIVCPTLFPLNGYLSFFIYFIPFFYLEVSFLFLFFIIIFGQKSRKYHQFLSFYLREIKFISNH